ncbi:MAG: hypothetical protein RBS57_01400 [Desulforhabdus sp.]|jgi:hypothetical protein|nr:hypothetical protein [Desulforhabdus sp.]
MLIVDKKEFSLGALLAISFLVVLVIMFLPLFGGRNAFEASDRLFNSIAKGSTYYIPNVLKQNEEFKGKSFDVSIQLANEEMLKRASQLFFDAGASVSLEGDQLRVQGDLGKTLDLALQHSDTVFHNRGDELAQKYGYSQKEVLFTWHSAFKALSRALTRQEKFKEATWIDEASKRSIEVAYNFYKIEPRSAGSAAGILSFSLVFYVIYTMWWGYAILFMFEGLGLQMKSGKKKEV